MEPLMSEDAVVTLAYSVTYGIVLWYAVRLHFRHRRLNRRG
jgi:hypothetical protein